MVRLKNFTLDEIMQRENNDVFHTFLIIPSKAHALFSTGFDTCTHMRKSTKEQFAGMKYIREQYIHFFATILLPPPHTTRLQVSRGAAVRSFKVSHLSGG